MQPQILVLVMTFLMINFLVELIYRLSILDNIKNWRIFNDDKYIINFLHSEDTFNGSIIDDEQHEAHPKI